MVLTWEAVVGLKRLLSKQEVMGSCSDTGHWWC